MTSTRWQKGLADSRAYRGRIAVMAAALWVALSGLGTMLTAYSILTREIRRNYTDTHPADATLLTDSIDEATLARIRSLPNVAEAEARATVAARVRVGRDWLPMLLFVCDDFDHLGLNRFRREAGAWPPPRGTLLIERSAEAMVGADIGSTLEVKTPRGGVHALKVSGAVHDAGLAPAWQERTCYCYCDRATLAALGEPAVLDRLRLRFLSTGAPLPAIEANARAVGAALESLGHPVRRIEVPPPGRHPHESQMRAVLTLFIGFSAMTLILSALLVATLLGGMLVRQTREIAIMKTLGARTTQIAALYAAMVLALSVVVVALSLPAALLTGTELATKIAHLLNLDLSSHLPALWVPITQAGAGLMLPLLFAHSPIRRASHMTVRAALADTGAHVQSAEQRRTSDGWSASSRCAERLRKQDRRGISPILPLALRNATRRRGRFWFAVTLMGASGAMFLTATNLRQAWQAVIARIYTERTYDVEIRLEQPAESSAVEAALRDVAGVKRMETWGYAPTAVSRVGQLDVVHAYPDQGHGSFNLFGVPAGSVFLHYPVLAGRWLVASDSDGVVLNHAARLLVPRARIGDAITLSANGKASTWRIVGLVEEVGSSSAAYVTKSAYERSVGKRGQAEMLRVALSSRTAGARADAIRKIDAALSAAGVGVRSAFPLAELKTAMGEHIVVLLGTLVAAAAIIAVVGVLGLGSMTMMNVVDRTREFGVLKAIGASPSRILRIVAAEVLFVGTVGGLVALPAAAALSYGLGRFIGRMAFQIPLPFAYSLGGLLIWAALVAAFSLLASILPARAAARLTVREALAAI